MALIFKTTIKTLVIVLFLNAVLVSCIQSEDPYDEGSPTESWAPSNFLAENEGISILLSWEQNGESIDGFLLEKSRDSIFWDTLGIVKSNVFQFVDSEISLGTFFYRIDAIAEKKQSKYCTTKLDVKCFCDEHRLGTFADNRDGHKYKTVTIGSQIWMAENLAFLPAVNKPFNAVKDKPYYYVYDYKGGSVEEAKTTVSYHTYGVLYNWYAAMISCPSGWHLPSYEEWSNMENYLKSNGYKRLAKSLSSTKCWTYMYYARDQEGWICYEPEKNNSSCFSALPGGCTKDNGEFISIGELARWWSSTQYSSSDAWITQMYNSYSSLYGYGEYTKLSGISVRCVKD